jgi:nucleotide-binding universal stress UspA family protein
MFQIRTVLCPVDLTELDARAIDLAVEVCRSFGARLILHHNIENVPAGPSVSWMYYQEHMNGRSPEKQASQALRTLMSGFPPEILAEARPAAADRPGAEGAGKPGHDPGGGRGRGREDRRDIGPPRRLLHHHGSPRPDAAAAVPHPGHLPRAAAQDGVPGVDRAGGEGGVRSLRGRKSEQSPYFQDRRRLRVSAS